MSYAASHAGALDGYVSAKPAPVLRADARAAAVANESDEHRSLAFKLIVDRLGSAQKTGVLDLGPAIPGNIEFLSRFNCKLHVEDLAASLGKLETAAKDGKPDGAAKHLEPYAEGTKFDLILAWDFFNYLELPVLMDLVSHLRGYCNPGALIFALIHTGKQMPEWPTGVHVVDENRLCYDVGGPRSCPQYGAPVLLKRLRKMHVLRTYLLQNGVQEYVFRTC